MSRILMVEDDEGMARGLAYNLEAEGYRVTVAADGEEGLKEVRAGGYDLILLDVMLPKRSGFEVLKRIRADGVDTPVLMLTARAEEVDRIAGLKLGADDYITKPFSLGELLARIEARLRNRPPGVVFDAQSLRIRNGSRSARLTPTEADLLKYLLAREGDVVPRGDLLRDLWGVESSTETRTLDNHVARLRRKLETDPEAPRILQTVHSVGYRIEPGTIALQDRDGHKPA